MALSSSFRLTSSCLWVRELFPPRIGTEEGASRPGGAQMFSYGKRPVHPCFPQAGNQGSDSSVEAETGSHIIKRAALTPTIEERSQDKLGMGLGAL